jgi:hypothetical protein
MDIGTLPCCFIRAETARRCLSKRCVHCRSASRCCGRRPEMGLAILVVLIACCYARGAVMIPVYHAHCCVRMK